MINNDKIEFWKSALNWKSSVSPKIITRVMFFVVFSLLVTAAQQIVGWDIDLAIGPFELSGAAMGLILVSRVNSGYDRWWEGRKCWGSILNHCRITTISVLHYGSTDHAWKREFTRWIIVLAYTTKKVLRADVDFTELEKLLSPCDFTDLMRSRNKIDFINNRMAILINKAYQSKKIDGFTFNRFDKERVFLYEQVGACERIAKSPLPLVMHIKIRRFILLFLLLTPFYLIHTLGWVSPLAMFIITYPLLALDQIGIELQNPFERKSLSHLPLNQFTDRLRQDILSIVDDNLGPDDELEPYYLFEHDKVVSMLPAVEANSKSTYKPWMDNKVSFATQLMLTIFCLGTLTS